jgi:pimeloyl-ACP methyl ester carboxylesterase
MQEKVFYLKYPYNAYCERIVPDKIRHKNPIIMIHGVAHTGSCYKVTPDGRPGWAYFFAKKGFEVYVIDWPGIGRSGYVPFEKIDGNFMTETFLELIKKINKKVIIFAHSMSGAYAWKLAELAGDRISSIVAIAPAEMGNIQSDPKIIKASKNSFSVKMPWGILSLDVKEWIKNDDTFIRNKLIGKSKIFPLKNLEEYKSSLQLRHPVLTYERLNVKKSQLRIGDFKKFNKTKVLIVNGTHDADHTKESKMGIINFLKDHWVKSELVWLGDKGIEGNGHMMMLEKNSDVIARLIYAIIKKS